MIPAAALPYFFAAALVAAGMAYVQGRRDGRELETAKAAREHQIAVMAVDKASSAAAAAIREIKVTNTTIKQRVEREIQTRVEYRDCRHAPGVLDDINETLTGKRPKPAGGGVVPSANPTGR